MVTWADGRSGVQPEVFYATIGVGASKAGDPVAEEAPAEVPAAFALEQNYPNPFNPATTLTFGLPENSDIQLAVYDVMGRQVAMLAEGTMPAGEHRVTFEAQGLPSGTYLARLTTPQSSFTRIMQLIK